MTAERLLVLYHPSAGGGRTRARVERLLRGSATAARSVRFVPVRTPHEAADALTRGGPASPRIVVAAGGDGTVNLVATALLQQEGDGPALAVLPLGTGNAFAAALGIRSPRAALRALARPELTRVDVMRTTHPAAPLALVSISGGFEARFIQQYGARRARWGRPAAALLAALAAQRGTRAPRIVAEGEALGDGRAFNAGLYNMRCYGFGLTMWPDADHHDGTAEAVVCAARRRYCALLGRGLRTSVRCDSADPRWTRWRRATVEAVAPLQIDGELVPPGSFEVGVEPGALRVVVPAGYGARRAAVAAD